MSKSKIPYEKKEEIARDYLEGRVGYTESPGRANNSKASFRYRVHQYQEKGSAGLLPSCKNHEYPEDIKRKAVEEYLAGRGSLEQIGGKYGLRSITQLRQWIKVYLSWLFACSCANFIASCIKSRQEKSGNAIPFSSIV